MQRRQSKMLFLNFNLLISKLHFLHGTYVLRLRVNPEDWTLKAEGNFETSLLHFSKIILSIVDPHFLKGAVLRLLKTCTLKLKCYQTEYQERTLNMNRNFRTCSIPRNPPSSWFCTLSNEGSSPKINTGKLFAEVCSLSTTPHLLPVSKCRHHLQNCKASPEGKKLNLGEKNKTTTMALALNFKEKVFWEKSCLAIRITKSLPSLC